MRKKILISQNNQAIHPKSPHISDKTESGKFLQPNVTTLYFLPVIVYASRKHDMELVLTRNDLKLKNFSKYRRRNAFV